MRLIQSPILLFSFLSMASLHGQQSFSVIYRHIAGNTKERLVFNDSMSFCYEIREGKDWVMPGNVFVEEVKSHCFYFNAKRLLTYYPGRISKGKKVNRGLYFFFDTLKTVKWVIYDQPKMILGYKSLPAVRADERGDSVLVWYTPEIPVPFGPSNFGSLPGLVLEVYHQRFGYTLAEKVEMMPLLIKFPEDARILNKSDYLKIRNKAYPEYSQIPLN